MTQSYASVPAMFLDRVAKTPDALAYQFPTADGGWGKLSWKETGERVRKDRLRLARFGCVARETCGDSIFHTR